MFIGPWEWYNAVVQAIQHDKISIRTMRAQKAQKKAADAAVKRNMADQP